MKRLEILGHTDFNQPEDLNRYAIQASISGFGLDLADGPESGDDRELGASMQFSTLPARLAVFAAGLALVVSLNTAPATADNPPTPEEYVAYVGGDARILPAGGLKLDGHTQRCGTRPTVLDPNLDDYGAAYPGFLIMNPKLLARVSTPVKKWIYAHECGHQFRGPDEETADCFAVQRGRRYGWLTQQGLNEVCTFIAPAKGDMMHLGGSHRCEYMRRCYADPSVR